MQIHESIDYAIEEEPAENEKDDDNIEQDIAEDKHQSEEIHLQNVGKSKSYL